MQFPKTLGVKDLWIKARMQKEGHAVKDAIQFQQFAQVSPVEWKYDIVTKNRTKYCLHYRVLHTGFAKELLMSDDKVIYDREYRIGEKLAWTFDDVIQNLGNVAQVLKKT